MPNTHSNTTKEASRVTLLHMTYLLFSVMPVTASSLILHPKNLLPSEGTHTLALTCLLKAQCTPADRCHGRRTATGMSSLLSLRDVLHRWDNSKEPSLAPSPYTRLLLAQPHPSPEYGHYCPHNASRQSLLLPYNPSHVNQKIRKVSPLLPAFNDPLTPKCLLSCLPVASSSVTSLKRQNLI